MEVIIVSDRAEKVWIIIGITAAIGFLVFLGFNFINMFSYLSYLPLVVTIYYVIWIATSSVILFIDLNYNNIGSICSPSKASSIVFKI